MTTELVDTLETLSISFCGVATLLWMSIGTFARTGKGEVLAQRTIASLCVTSAIMLIVLNSMGGELWGSGSMALPMALVAVIVAISATLNLKGKDVQGEANPHQIRMMRREEE
ncbi:MAG: hypothetical protein CMB58_002650 [Methanobacteriota archaeon]|nr:MAG: hypothetical protein CMB58_002650 [Euryarchaeota archaeon]|tara:strand:+ start:4819 stop:5157 length:339 start_codon:yes stop_codon:yes gene_type:complete